MPRRFVDDALAAKLHLEDKVPVAIIAKQMRVQPPAIYRALYRQGVKPMGRPANDGPKLKLPPQPAHNGNPACPPASKVAKREEEAALPRVDRDPCWRCGVRGDIGCGCPKPGLQWITL